ncbi:MAG: hypothetical protein ABSB33_11940 [Tepidisphaeraceae bacterium]
MRTIAAPPPAAFIDRALVRQLSRAAALADRVACDPPTNDFRLAQFHQLESQAKAELRELRDRLAGMRLD